MTNGNILVLDVGGSFLKYGVADQRGALLPGSVGEAPARADESPEKVYEAFGEVIRRAQETAPLAGACACFPGPFDYTEGVFRMKHKFQALYGCSILPPFERAGLPVRFLHDSTSYILGEVSDGTLQGTQNPCCVMLGTGLGFSMMKDGKALQSGTSHYFGDKFSRAYDVTFTGRDNTLQYPFQTSWGASTRLIGAIIMTHGDDDGLILPPAIAPVQVVIVPVAAHKPGVLDKCRELAAEIGKYARVKLDDSDKQPGWKFAQWEMKGVPVRLEVGPRDIENGQCVLVRRDTREKQFVKFEDLATAIPAAMEALAKDLYDRALQNRENRTWSATTMDEVKKIVSEKTGFVKTMWCGDLACEEAMKTEAGLSSRSMPFEQEHLSDVCPVCGKPAKSMVVWGIAY